MSETARASSTDDESSQHGELVTTLEPLHPVYDASNHKTYVDHIDSALNKEAKSVFNIALTGSYGVGKSSILKKVAENHSSRTLNISLATLSGDAIRAQHSATDAIDGTPQITNLIQKEIVKQLLYKVSSSRVPRSRYSRTHKFQFWSTARKVATVLLALAFVGLSFGWIDLSTLPLSNPWQLQLCSALLSLAILTTLITKALEVTPNRIQLGGEASAGGASITLSPESDNFFDEYLDEIVYFFEETSYDIVILEDIDRFDDPYIFETLRELNTILNGSEQLSQRPIRFIYAIKDSIFEQLGELEAKSGSQRKTSEELARVARTNRTKFFDIVIPVVPFITHKNSRDHLTAELKRRNIRVPQKVISLTARHITEKRLITNVVNEYVVFAERIFAADGVKGLKPERLLAMIVYKNLFLADYEEITHGDSNLDMLYEAYRGFVDANIERLDAEIALLRKQISVAQLRTRQAAVLASRLEKYMKFLAKYASAARQGSFVHNGISYPDDDLSTPSFWDELAKTDSPLSLPFVNQDYYGNRHAIQLTRADVEEILDTKLEEDSWHAIDHRDYRDRIAKARKDREYLRHASLSDLLAEPKFYQNDAKRTLRTITEELFHSQLVQDLLDAELIEQNFTLYVSQYQGNVVKPFVRTFIMRNVEKNSVDVFYPLGSDVDVEQLLMEATESRWADRFMYNVSIFNYLLKGNDPRLDGMLPQIARFDEDAQAFLLGYLATEGAEGIRLVERLTPHWDRAFVYVSDEAEIDEDLRLALLDAALRWASSETEYESSDLLIERVRADYGKLKSFTDTTNTAAVLRLCALMKDLRIKLPSLTGLSAEVKTAVVAKHLFEFSEDNLANALGHADLALDLAVQKPDIYGYIKNNIDEYARIAVDSPKTEFTIRNQEAFGTILEENAGCEQATLRLIIGNSAPDCKIVSLSERPDNLWPLLAEFGRFPASFANVIAYFENYELDESLASHLNEARSISGASNDEDDADRMKIAVAILNATDIEPEAKVSIAKSLRLRHYVKVGDLNGSTNRRPDLFRLLVGSDVISDTATNFNLLKVRPWAVRENFVAGSEKFAGYLDELELLPEEFRGLAKSEMVSWEVKRGLLSQLQNYSEFVDGLSCGPMARLALSKQYKLSVADIALLASKKVRADTIVELVLTHADSINRIEFLNIMRHLPDPYVRLSKPLAKPRFADTVTHRKLLDLAKRLGMINEYKLSKNMLRTAMKGFAP